MTTESTTETVESLPSPKKMLGIASRFAAFDHALSIDEVADVLGLGKKTVERWARADRIPSFKLGNQVRFDPRLLAEWAKTARGDKRKRSEQTSGGRNVHGRLRLI